MIPGNIHNKKRVIYLYELSDHIAMSRCPKCRHMNYVHPVNIGKTPYHVKKGCWYCHNVVFDVTFVDTLQD